MQVSNICRLKFWLLLVGFRTGYGSSTTGDEEAGSTLREWRKDWIVGFSRVWGVDGRVRHNIVLALPWFLEFAWFALWCKLDCCLLMWNIRSTTLIFAIPRESGSQSWRTSHQRILS